MPENTSAGVQGYTMNKALTAICGAAGTGSVMRSPRANARLAPGGRKRRWQRGTGVAQSPQADEAARWQRILDLLDPGKRCGAWAPATFEGRPVVCTRTPHDAREEHANAETGWRWSDETS
jgi:hypothetical protein